jgi:glutamyl-tRNA synthetase
MKVKTRFAPSPTGFLHMGSARTALFNWLFARHHGGEFILRIEDTDRERSKKEFEVEIIESLKWLGLDWDAPLVYQMDRLAIYQKYAEKLIAEGKAVREGEGQAVRFKSPKVMIGWDDVIRGRIEFDGNLLNDLVLLKSDGVPTYNFAVVIDDHEMGITHVIRGEDHISNTPKQIPLYAALGFEMPKFAHIPLILGEDRSRLSKRHGATSVRDYKLAGYLPQAIVNYLALLGWSPGNNQEIIALAEMIEKFSLERVQSTGAIFNIKKMDWVNGEYIRAFSPETLKGLFIETLLASGLITEAPESGWMDRFTALYRERVFVLKDLPSETAFSFKDEAPWDEEGDKVLKKDAKLPEIFVKYADCLAALPDFGHESVEKASREFMTAVGVSGKQFIHPCRIAVTGRMVSPGFFDTVSLVGKERSVKRLRAAAEKLKAAGVQGQ